MAFFCIGAVSAAYGSDIPPGCNPKYQGTIGGCNGKAQIEQLKLDGAPSCLYALANNCNGGVVEINNRCEGRNLSLGSLTIAPLSNDRGTATAVELEKDNNQKITIKESRGNYASYFPKETEELSIDGDMEGQKVKLSYIKTKQLCE